MTLNYKLLFPTYLNRYRFVQWALQQYGAFGQGLSLGTGEGDYDAMIAKHCQHLIACDINEQDIAFAKALNHTVKNLDYQVENALALSFENDTFDLLVSVEVIEHVGNPQQMMREVARVLRPGGIAIITFPSLDFPFSYDPVNKFSGRKVISQGAYAFGHEYLISPADFRQWLKENRMTTLQEQNLSGYLIGFLEMYWTGWVQRIFKANAANVSEKSKKMALRPSVKEPALTAITDGLLFFDKMLFKNAKYAIGKGFVIRKETTYIQNENSINT